MKKHIIFLFIISQIYLLSCEQNTNIEEHPKAIEGILNLTDWDFDTSPPVELKGDWELYWQQFLHSSDFKNNTDIEKTGYFTLPGIWNGYQAGGEKLKGKGYGTFRLKILINDSVDRIAFKILAIQTASHMYINGKLVSTGGVPMIGKYININLTTIFSISNDPVYLQLSQILFILFMGIMALSQFLIWNHFIGSEIVGSKRRKLIFFSIFILLMISLGSLALYLDISYAYVFLETIGDLLFFIDFVILILILIRSFKLKNTREIRLLRSYSIIFLTRYPLIFLMFLIPEPLRFFSAILVLFYFNGIPLIWTLLFFGRGSLNEKSNFIETDQLSEKLKRNKITPRENEIVKLLLAGKSNSEIEEMLFISSHTVKNHIYNIYRKLEVKNRYEMISLLSFNKLP